MAAGFTILPEFWMPFGEKEMEKKRKWNKKKEKESIIYSVSANLFVNTI